MHSGTTIMQHSLIAAAGYNISRPKLFPGQTRRMGTNAPEGWPPSNISSAFHDASCSTQWVIYKKPTRNTEELTRMLRLADWYPKIRLVFMMRDGPSQVWSRFDRLNKTHDAALQEGVHRWCEVNAVWKGRPTRSPDRPEWTVTLADFSQHSKQVLRRIMHVQDSHRRLLESAPFSRQQHSSLRQWQAHQPVYEYSESAVWNQMPAHAREFLRTAECDASLNVSFRSGSWGIIGSGM